MRIPKRVWIGWEPSDWCKNGVDEMAIYWDRTEAKEQTDEITRQGGRVAEYQLVEPKKTKR